MESLDFPLPMASNEYQLALAVVDFAIADVMADCKVAALLRARATRRSLQAIRAMLCSKLLLLGMSHQQLDALSWEQMAEYNPEAVPIISWYLEGLSPAGRVAIAQSSHVQNALRINRQADATD